MRADRQTDRQTYSSQYFTVQYVNNSFVVGAWWNLSETGPRHTDEELGYIFYGNRLVGVPRLRQLRVVESASSCKLPVDQLGAACFAPYSPHAESFDTYGQVPGYTLHCLV